MNKVLTFVIVSMLLATPGFASEKEANAPELNNDDLMNMVGLPTGNEAFAELAGTTGDIELNGTVHLVETNEGALVTVNISGNIEEGKHGIHIHENGSCDDAGKAAGGHFNPAETKHGLLPKDGHEHAHAGDMGNIEIDSEKNGELGVFLPGISLSEGKMNVAGKAIILHAKEDDFGQPTGNAGGRIGCGLITTADSE